MARDRVRKHKAGWEEWARGLALRMHPGSVEDVARLTSVGIRRIIENGSLGKSAANSLRQVRIDFGADGHD